MKTAPTAATKHCPACRSLLVADAASCVCGQRFAAAATALDTSADLVTKAEELYESHLRARLQHAIRTLKFAKIDVLRAPNDVMKMARLRQAERDVKDFETQVAVQATRVATVRSAASPANGAKDTTVDATVFREAQAVKAKDVIDFARVQQAAEHGEAAHGTARFSTTQRQKAEQVRESASATDDIPNPMADIGGDFLTDEEKSALRKTT